MNTRNSISNLSSELTSEHIKNAVLDILETNKKNLKLSDLESIYFHIDVMLKERDINEKQETN